MTKAGKVVHQVYTTERKVNGSAWGMALCGRVTRFYTVKRAGRFCRVCAARDR